MDPPARPHIKRRAVSSQMSSAILKENFVSDGSPSPFASNPKYMEGGAEIHRPRPRRQTVSVAYSESDDALPQSRAGFKIQLAECVETKTVTTTTTTKRTYPPLLVRQQSLDKLDMKEYPLAMKPTPPELTQTCYEVDGETEELYEVDDRTHVAKVCRASNTSRPAKFLTMGLTLLRLV